MTNAKGAINFALRQLNKPYVWGAEGPNSYDCSGLMVDSYKQGCGITLPRTTQAMLADPHLMPVNKGQLQPGDLVFPSTEHVQMYLGGGKVVEAPHTGLTVRIASLGTVYAARRVTDPATGVYGGSPVTGTTPATGVTGSDVQSVAAQTVGVGLSGAFASIIGPLLKEVWFIAEIGMGFVLIGAGIFLIAGKAIPT